MLGISCGLNMGIWVFFVLLDDYSVWDNYWSMALKEMPLLWIWENTIAS